MMQIVSCRMPPDMVSKLDVVAKDGNLCRCEVIRRMLWFYIDELERVGELGDERND